MSHQASGYVKGLLGDQVTRRQKLLLLILADYHNTETHNAYPSLKTLARESLMDEREAQRVLNEVEGRIIERVSGQGSGHLTAYRFIALDKEIPGYITPFLRAQKDGQKPGQKDGQKPGQKDGQNQSAIRKEELEPELKLEPEPEREGGTAEKQAPTNLDFAITKNPQNTSSDLARKFCRDGGISLTTANVAVIAAAITAESDLAGVSPLEAAQALAGHVDAARDNGIPINRFFFEDSKWRDLSRQGGQASERSRRSKENILAGIAADNRRRDAEERIRFEMRSQGSADSAKRPEGIVGKCQGCGRERFASSTWTDYCADSCRDAHKRGVA